MCVSLGFAAFQIARRKVAETYWLCIFSLVVAVVVVVLVVVVFSLSCCCLSLLFDLEREELGPLRLGGVHVDPSFF